MTKKLFEAYYDDYMKQWNVRNTETLAMYPVTSENMANEFTNLLNNFIEENIKLKVKNQKLEYRIIEILDFIKENDGVSRQEMKDWWNKKK